ncbi:Receptor-like protein 12 [Vitis vinifera]|uniref:Receptor-like protein 12 n=2 Tax=Vitis vinifera TaxID=29760 RepID=A0A438HHS0_VITVI|nr:Receptor-like protein 12 [Vitis vinifera]
MPLCSIIFGIHITLVSGECLSDGRVCLEDEMSLLLRLKKTLKFNVAVSNKLVSWNRSADCSSWGGVTWDANGHVVGLDLSSESISGGFNSSSSLFSLQYLQSLNLAGNSFCGGLNWPNNSFCSSQIPSGFDRLANLIYLNLSNSGFSGQIPKEFSLLTSLVTIDFSSLGYLIGFPTLKLENPNLRMLVQNLKELRELHLNGVDISAEGKEWCQALSSSVPNLQVLSLSSCHLSGPIHSSLQKLRSLSRIRLDDNNFAAPVPQFLASFSNLTHLQLSSCGLTGTFPEKIIQVTTLQILDLSINLLEDSLPEFPQNGSLETLVLSDTKLWGKLPNSMGNLKKLTSIELARCHFSGPILNSVANLPQLIYLDLSENKFSGPIPSFSLSKRLTEINLSYNNLMGPIPFHWEQLVNLMNLDLRYNAITGNLPPSLFSLPSLQRLRLDNNQISGQFKILLNASSSRLSTLGLSSNNLKGPIPDSVFELRCLSFLDLSSNKFNGKIELSKFKKLGNLTDLSLSYNNLSINATLCNLSPSILPMFTTLSYVDYSNNSFTSSIPEDIGTYIFFTIFFSLSKNNITGMIPASICNASYLRVLDFSDNALSGMIPSCLIGNEILEVLNLRRNKLSATIPGEFSGNCLLRTLDLNGNLLEGKIPESLANCKELELSYHESHHRPHSNPTWPLLQIIDLASNNFTGDLSGKFFLTWKAMRADKDGARSELNHLQLQVLQFGQVYYQDTVTVTSKGLEMQLVKILTVFTAIDFSFNNFQGEIPEAMGSLISLYALNLSHNALTGQIPSSLGKLRQLESLDLSQNSLRGEIPPQFVSLNFLSFLNLSFNQLEGEIPTGTQLQTFLESSYEGNKELCGPPLKRKCTDPSPPTSEETHPDSGMKINWVYIGAEIGFVTGIGIVIGPLVLWRRWRRWYYTHVDRLLLRILPRQGGGVHGRRRHRSQRQRL